MNNAFLKSFQTLQQVYAERAFSSLALNKTLLSCRKQDKALITKIVYGVLDNDIKLEWIISRYVSKMPKGDVLLYLKIGTYCLAELNMPIYAVVNDVAELSKLSEDRRIVGFVNAVLKKISQTIKTFDDYPEDKWERLSVMYSYPLWALKKLVKDYGEQEATQIISHAQDNRTTVRFSLPVSAEQIAQKYGVDVCETVFEDAYFVKGNMPVDGNEYTVQSLSSMAISRICANLLPENASVLDSCSAPGGKSVYIKQLRQDANITSCDVHAHRVQLVKSYASRMGVQLNCVCLDMTQFCADWQNSFDLVLCDVPCSGFGVLDNRPDIKLFRENKDISDLMKLQYAILSNCSRYVKKGGYLVYSTCTLFDNENGQNIRKFFKEHSDFTYGNIVLPQFPLCNGANYYQFLPHRDKTQGFFVAVLKRTE